MCMGNRMSNLPVFQQYWLTWTTRLHLSGVHRRYRVEKLFDGVYMFFGAELFVQLDSEFLFCMLLRRTWANKIAKRLNSFRNERQCAIRLEILQPNTNKTKSEDVG